MENTGSSLDQFVTRAALDELAARIVAGAGQISAHLCRWLLLIAEFDSADGAPIFGLVSTAQWLSHACGIASRTAAEHVRVARALREFPALADEMSAGRLSYSQVRAISRVPRPGEFQLVEHLVEVARHGTAAQLEVVARGLRSVDHDERGLSQAEREYVTEGWTAESLWRLSARLDPERGAVVRAALQRVAASEELSPIDALVRLAEIGLAALADSENSPRLLRGDELAAVVIHLDSSRMSAAAGASHASRSAEPCAPTRDKVSAGPPRPYARIANGPGLPDRVVQRLLCAGRIRTVLHDSAGNVLDVGRSHRLVTERQYRALLLRQHGHCAHPGCPNTKNLHAHHVLYWLLGGGTDLDNLILLCERHHVAHHDGAFRIIAMGKGRFGFERRDGVNLGKAPVTPGTGSGLEEAAEAGIAPDAATPLWHGERLDRRYAISVLAGNRNLGAET